MLDGIVPPAVLHVTETVRHLSHRPDAKAASTRTDAAQFMRLAHAAAIFHKLVKMAVFDPHVCFAR